MTETYQIKILAYGHGEKEPLIDMKKTGILYPDLDRQTHKLVSKAISNEAFEMIIDIFKETKGAK